jgi:hypothetical protein
MASEVVAVCPSYARGKCIKGPKCKFAHKLPFEMAPEIEQHQDILDWLKGSHMDKYFKHYNVENPLTLRQITQHIVSFDVCSSLSFSFFCLATHFLSGKGDCRNIKNCTFASIRQRTGGL